MTVNDTAGYTWAGFGPRCIEAVKRLFDAHPSRQEFAVQELALRYIDAVDVDFEAEKVTDFIRDKLKIRIELPDALFVNGRVKPGPSAFAWHAAFPQDDPGGIISLRFSMGQHNGKPALIWETLVQTSRDGLPSLPDQFPAWLEKAHQITSDWFFTLIEGDLERRFRDGG
jgi:uncharacterized protein (TIGR04255 family)